MADERPAPSPGPAAPESTPERLDRRARLSAVDPRQNVVLEASAGTGKTSVLVERYVNLLRAGVDPANILAITFTRKAAAEMRQRIIDRLRQAAGQSAEEARRWHTLRDRLGEIAISTIDAFCLSLLHEFPLEANLDPDFEIADETDVLRVTEDALDRAFRVLRPMAAASEEVALVFGRLGEARLRTGLERLLARRLTAGTALERFLAGVPAELSVEEVCGRAIDRIRDLFTSVPGGVDRFLSSGPVKHPRFGVLASDMRRLCSNPVDNPAPGRFRDRRLFGAAIDEIGGHFLTKAGDPRRKMAPGFRPDHAESPAAWNEHARHLVRLAPVVQDVLRGLSRDLNVILARGVWDMFRVARREYAAALKKHGLLDFPGVLLRALTLLRNMEEFSQSRYRLEARYHHVLVDEFQDTNRAQWQLISLLIQSWGEGAGLASEAPVPPSIFIVGDRKQSIYRFRDADVTVLGTARRRIAALRPTGSVRRSISRSFRAVPALQRFTNDLFSAVEKVAARRDRFRFGSNDRFPVPSPGGAEASDALGLVVGDRAASCAGAVAGEVDRLIGRVLIRDRQSGVRRMARPGDIAVLFRSRESHRELERALEARAIPSYVYRGLGFFDADEIKDVTALLMFLADPGSDMRAAAFLRSRFVRVSDRALAALAPSIASALRSVAVPAVFDRLDAEDRAVLSRLRGALPGWTSLVDLLPPAEVLDRLLEDSAYAVELRGPRLTQARENLKKLRTVVRTMQNRGYATLERIAEHLVRLSAGDEANAVVDAVDAVSLMTVHAAKGLEFPIVFLVNMERGVGGAPDPIRVTARPTPSVSVGEFRSEADEDTRIAELEETKRLLYVATTRARDLLFLSAVLKGPQPRPGHGSLAEVLPASLWSVVADAAAGGATGTVEWSAPSGCRHRFRVCPPAAAEMEHGGLEAAGELLSTNAPTSTGPDVHDDFAPLRDFEEPQRVAATSDAVLGRDHQTAGAGVGRGTASDEDDQALAGTLVHRLLQFGGTGPGRVSDRTEIERQVHRLARPSELAAVADPFALVARVADAYLAMLRRPGLLSLLESGECWYEVPFSSTAVAGMPAGAGDLDRERPFGRGPVIVRGTIDCMVRRPGGELTVLEFKTGRPRPEHEVQLQVYLAVTRDLFPAATVDGFVIYPGP